MHYRYQYWLAMPIPWARNVPSLLSPGEAIRKFNPLELNFLNKCKYIYYLYILYIHIYIHIIYRKFQIFLRLRSMKTLQNRVNFSEIWHIYAHANNKQHTQGKHSYVKRANTCDVNTMWFVIFTENVHWHLQWKR